MKIAKGKMFVEVVACLSETCSKILIQCMYENYINNSLETLIQQKRKSPPVGVEPNAFHSLDEHPRPLDHRGFLICHRSLIQVIHIVVTELWLSILFTRHHLHIPSAQCFTTAHLFRASARVVYHHLNNWFSSVLLQWKCIYVFITAIYFCFQCLYVIEYNSS